MQVLALKSGNETVLLSFCRFVVKVANGESGLTDGVKS